MFQSALTSGDFELMRGVHDNWDNDEYDFEGPKEVMLGRISQTFPKDTITALSIKRVKDGLVFFRKGDSFMGLYYVVSVNGGGAFRVASEGEMMAMSSNISCDTIQVAAQFSNGRAKMTPF